MPHRTQRYSKIGDTMKTIDLSGKWNYKTDIDDSQTIDSIKFENNNSMSLQQFAEVLHVYAIATGNIHLTEQGKKLLKK